MKKGTIVATKTCERCGCDYSMSVKINQKAFDALEKRTCCGECLSVPECQHCGDPCRGRSKQYCTPACGHDSMRIVFPDRICEVCDKKYSHKLKKCGKHESMNEWTERKYCSNKCTGLALQEGPTEFTEDMSPWQRKRLELKNLKELKQLLKVLQLQIYEKSC